MKTNLLAALAALLPVASLLCAAEAPKTAAPDDPVDLAGHVRVLLERKCNECHGAHLLKPEGKFGHVLDLARLATEPDYIVKGDPAKSEFFRVLKDGEMPPDDQTKFARLTPGELDLVRRWILINAPSQLPAVLPRGPVVAQEASVASADAVAARERTRQKLVTIEAHNQPLGEVLAEIERRTKITIEYERPVREPLASITLKNGTLFEALHYLALRGNLALTFGSGHPRLGRNPPPDLPHELAPLTYRPLVAPAPSTPMQVDPSPAPSHSKK